MYGFRRLTSTPTREPTTALCVVSFGRNDNAWTSLAQQHLCCALVRGRGIVFLCHIHSMAKSAVKDFRDGAVVPFE